MMRYHWGLAVGHVYSRGLAAETRGTTTIQCDTAAEPDSNILDEVVPVPDFAHYEHNSDIEDPELGFDDREDDWVDIEDGLEDELERDYDDDLLVAMDDMYGLGAPEGYYD